MKFEQISAKQCPVKTLRQTRATFVQDPMCSTTRNPVIPDPVMPTGYGKTPITNPVRSSAAVRCCSLPGRFRPSIRGVAPSIKGSCIPQALMKMGHPSVNCQLIYSLVVTINHHTSKTVYHLTASVSHSHQRLI